MKQKKVPQSVINKLSREINKSAWQRLKEDRAIALYPEIMPKKNITKKEIQELADEINTSIWKKFKKLRNK